MTRSHCRHLPVRGYSGLVGIIAIIDTPIDNVSSPKPRIPGGHSEDTPIRA
ncbi:MAG TPA: hypothetical protein VGS06_26845 [Streptosporangiaceae bacterium]|nr:hypothetical protein [Streptosporangiaceae bacterium]